nr:AtpZ/AtpI family protein [Methylomarinum sp. Ch1-1]MDP4522405.1 AtpZ/AtpI family protein [Methylomarinum sp. Ch1-1]
MTKSVEEQAERKLKARQNRRHGVWFGLGMFGLVGWSVAIPTLAGIALGVWIDKRWPGQISWTLTLMFVGVVLGCLNAWRWIGEESRDD